MGYNLTAEDFPPTLSAAVVESIQQAISDFRRPAIEESRDLVSRNLAQSGCYVAITAKDLDIWRDVIVAVGGCAAAVPNLVAIAGSLVLLLYRLRRHQVRLNGLQGAVLLELRRHGPAGCTVTELFDSLGIAPELRKDASEALKFLESAPAQNREPKVLVIRSSDRVRAADV